MRFEIARREVDVRWGHVAVVLASIAAIVVPTLVLAMLWAYALPPEPVFSFQENSAMTMAWLLSVLDLIASPISAFLLLTFAMLLKMKKDVALCRSLAGAEFLLMAAFDVSLFAAAFLLSLAAPVAMQGSARLAVSTPAALVSTAGGAIVVYLWLLAIAAPDRKKAEQTLVPAAVFALLAVAIGVFPAVIDLAGGGFRADAGPYIMSLQTGFSLLLNFIFGFIILYHAQGKRLDGAACLFAALYVASPFLGMLATLVEPGIFMPEQTITAALKLALLYGLSRVDLKDIL